MSTAHWTRLRVEKNSFAALVPAVRSALLLFCTLFPLNFLSLIFHEGGHALVDLVNGGTVDLFYVHPFSLNGYVRPIHDWQSIGVHVAGGAAGITAALFIFLLAWKRRSAAVLPLVMLFPWTAVLLGLLIMLVSGDWQNVVALSGMPEIILNITGGLLLLLGLFLFVSVFPLLGLAPQDKRSLIVIPAAFALWGGMGIAVGYLFVPGSAVDVQYGLGGELLSSVKTSPLVGLAVGLLLAGIYVSLYRKIRSGLPAALRTETAALTWSDLRIPGLVASACVILGLILIQ